MRASRSPLAPLLLLAVAVAPLAADEAQSTRPAADATDVSPSEEYLLRYHFQPGETIRWQVVHRARIITTVSGSTQTAETLTSSIKVWRVSNVDDQGTATFENMVESVDMSQNVTGRAEIRYNSQKDKQPPVGFESVAQSLGVPLSVITLDNRGAIVRRENKNLKAAAPPEHMITIPLPEEPVTVGESWTLPFDDDLPLPNGTVKKIKTQQKLTLTGVRNGVATIELTTQILTPIHDPAIEALLVQRESHGSLRFDVDAGRIIGQKMDLDRRVVGFRGEASSLHYVTQFTEELLPGRPAQTDSETASRSQPSASETK